MRMSRVIKPLVTVGPSGVGKSTLTKMLMAAFPDSFAFAPSHTTRMPREGEIQGVHYHFVSKEEMLRGIEKNEFLEHADVHGNLYGTSYASIQKVLDAGRICILDKDVQGVKAFKEKNFDAYFIFFRPVSFSVLEERLLGRGTESSATLTRRLESAKKEMDFLEQYPQYFDKVIVNDVLETAYQELVATLRDWQMLPTS